MDPRIAPSVPPSAAVRAPRPRSAVLGVTAIVLVAVVPFTAGAVALLGALLPTSFGDDQGAASAADVLGQAGLALALAMWVAGAALGAVAVVLGVLTLRHGRPRRELAIVGIACGGGAVVTVAVLLGPAILLF